MTADEKKKASKKASQAKWRAANTEKCRKHAAKWRAENPEKQKAGIAKWQAANRDKMNANQAKWSASNPEYNRIKSHNRRAKVQEAGGKLSAGIAERLFVMQRGKCACCGAPLGADYHLDHIMPLALGGSNTDDNMQLLRQRCNLQKYAKHPVEFMQSRGYLL